MLSFLKTITGFGSNQKAAVNETDGELSDEYADADDDGHHWSGQSSDADDCRLNGMNGPTAGAVGGGDSDDGEEVDGVWNDEWNAMEELPTDISRQLLDTNVKCRSTKGLITEKTDCDQIVIDGKHRIKYTKSTFGDVFVGDLVSVEINDDKEVVLKPLRYKIMTGKITDYQRHYHRFVFCGHAVCRRDDKTDYIKSGDVIKMMVIETKADVFNWRAIPYDQVYHNYEVDVNVDQIDVYTNDLMADKNSIEITKRITFGEMKMEAKKKVLVYIKNRGQRPQTLLSCDVEEGENQIKFYSFHATYAEPSDRPFVIPAQSESYVELVCDAKYSGEYSELLVFVFEGFKIGRFVTVTVYEGRGQRYDSQRRNIFGANTWIISGEKVFKPNKHIFDKLYSYKVPEPLWRAIENNWSVETPYPELQQPLNKDNYRIKFHTMVFLEECDSQLQLQGYDLTGVQFKKSGKFLALKVPGLAEGRPSLIISDRLVTFDESGGKTDSNNKVIGFEGYIHDIRKDEIWLRFTDEFHQDFANGGPYKVMFQLSRTIFRRCHHAIDLSPHMVDQVLFPGKVVIKAPFKRLPFDSMHWFNKSLNLQQKLAVWSVVKGKSRPTPYIIFGPPGTGKTVTIVESILQVFDKLPHSRIIACTAANSSADLIATKLLESGRVTEDDLMRVSALHRMNAIPEAVKCVTQSADEDEKKWMYHRIIVTTSSQAGVVFKYKITPTHFTHVFIDEAAQVTEPESLIPISMSAIGHGVVVLAGDHRQLGPVIMSLKAKANRLDRSLMERLMNSCEPYARNDEYKKHGFYNPNFITKLLENYRSDGVIMAIPSKLFYDNELNFNCKTDDKLLQSLKLKSSIVFVGVKGDDRQDTDCPSWYNPHEIIQVCAYLEDLYNAGVDPEDIGVITPYRKQVTKLRTHMRDMGLKECRVATIEEFQGLEKRVILVTMVRSKQDNLDHDMRFNLGFVHNAKRFNVAVSRAMSLLICIGNPHLLSKDKCWSKLLDYCVDNGYYTGCPYKRFK